MTNATCKSQQQGAAHRWSRTRGALHLREFCDNMSGGLVQMSRFPKHGSGEGRAIKEQLRSAFTWFAT